MTEERASYNVAPKSAPAGEHEHLFRISAGGGKVTVRYCERCRRTWLISELREIVHSRTLPCWVEVLEEDEAREKLSNWGMKD